MNRECPFVLTLKYTARTCSIETSENNQCIKNEGCRIYNKIETLELEKEELLAAMKYLYENCLDCYCEINNVKVKEIGELLKEYSEDSNEN